MMNPAASLVQSRAHVELRQSTCALARLATQMRLEDAAPETGFRSVWLRLAEGGSGKIGPMARHNKAKRRREPCCKLAFIGRFQRIDCTRPGRSLHQRVAVLVDGSPHDSAGRAEAETYTISTPGSRMTLNTKTRRRAAGNSGRITGNCESKTT
ncbi:hypothetical protein CT0861_02502 [Colletotrichum tofieldiae]|uniref:Uncharacterized protein n=1 Tax=Colletotrichum tofieldiae TaxID=708197 RepID=A0A161VJH8_9PEZI|nr:hypothetical protein CT0861_02502 [Colletotrichum tofieldiae]